jgi:hypothetical protein
MPDRLVGLTLPETANLESHCGAGRLMEIQFEFLLDAELSMVQILKLS